MSASTLCRPHPQHLQVAENQSCKKKSKIARFVTNGVEPGTNGGRRPGDSAQFSDGSSARVRIDVRIWFRSRWRSGSRAQKERWRHGIPFFTGMFDTFAIRRVSPERDQCPGRCKYAG